MESPLLMIPGPAPIDDDVRAAMSKPMISHRSPEFESVYEDCRRNMKEILGTDNELLFINGSGSAAMEAAVSNTVSDEDTVVCIENGKFGEKFERIVRRYTDHIRSVSFEWGKPFLEEEIKEAVDNTVTAITMVHSDTSTGLTNPVEPIADIAADHDALLIVDCITSAGSEDVQTDKWGVDFAITASQKSLGAPPGLSVVTVSENAKKRSRATRPPLYLDIQEHIKKAQTNQTPTTSSVQVFWGLQEALNQAEAEGFDTRVDRFFRLAKAIRKGTTAMGLEPYSTTTEDTSYANAVTVINTPTNLDTSEIVTRMRNRGVLIRAGLGDLSSETIRVGTMGATRKSEVIETVAVLQDVLGELNYPVEDDGVAVVENMLS